MRQLGRRCAARIAGGGCQFVAPASVHGKRAATEISLMEEPQPDAKRTRTSDKQLDKQPDRQQRVLTDLWLQPAPP